ncbi:MAG: dephospho-CoA kinase, partial [Jiangellales bacterium]
PRSSTGPRRVGLTGGIGAGKSAVSSLLAERGATIVDADSLAREVVAPGSEGLAEIEVAFGPGVLDGERGLDRAAMAEVVFADPSARQRLEAIIHPRVRALAAQIEADAWAADPDAVVVHDVPLLVETGQQGDYDLVLVVDVPVAAQVQRLVSSRSMSEAEARGRIAAQAGRDERVAAADVVIDNSGTRDDLARRVAAVWHEHLACRRPAGGTPSPE